MGAVRDLWNLGVPWEPAAARNWGEAASDAIDAGAGVKSGLVIVEITSGVWSADAPARTLGENPIVFVGLNDPADVTNGITTPANINSRDRWVELSAL